VEAVDGQLQVMSPKSKSSMTEMELFSGALRYYQGKSKLNRMLGRRSIPTEVLSWLLTAVPGEMVKRGVILTATGNWFRDRFYEAGMDLTLLPSVGLSAVDAGKLSAVLCVVLISLAVIFVQAADDELPSLETMGDSEADHRKHIQDILQDVAKIRVDDDAMGRMFRSSQSKEKLANIIGSVVNLCGTIAASTAFILTGNLASPLTVAAAIRGTKDVLVDLELSRDGNSHGLKFTKPGSVTESIQRKSYLKVKELFQKQLLEEEKKLNPEEENNEKVQEPSPESSEGGNEPSTEYGPKQEVSDTLNLEICGTLLRMTHTELEMALSTGKLKEAEREPAETEKAELEGLLERYSEVKKGMKEETPLKLDFFRDVKDRYKGGKK